MFEDLTPKIFPLFEDLSPNFIAKYKNLSSHFAVDKNMRFFGLGLCFIFRQNCGKPHLTFILHEKPWKMPALEI